MEKICSYRVGNRQIYHSLVQSSWNTSFTTDSSLARSQKVLHIKEKLNFQSGENLGYDIGTDYCYGEASMTASLSQVIVLL